MAPKRHLGESSTTSRTFDKKKFVNAEPTEKFDTYLVNKALTPERGLRPDEVLDGQMARMIAKQGWETFTDQSEPVVIAIVKEFYANVVDESSYAVMIRGKTVSFSGDTINEFYNLTKPAYCHYARFITQNPNYEKILHELGKHGSVWTPRGQRGSMIFPFNCLSRYGKIWYAFLCVKLLPSTHVSDVTKDMAVLLYAIVTEMKINVGDVIEASIRKNLWGPTQSGLPHPSLICGLCRQAGVKWGANESLQQPMTLLDHGLIERNKVWEGGESHPCGLGFIIRHPSPTDDADDEDDQAPAADSELPSTSGLQRNAKFSSQFHNL